MNTARSGVRPIRREEKRPMGSAHPFEVGDLVEHRVFGEGLIIKSEGQGTQKTVIVRFSSDGKQRKLRVKQAKLKKKTG